MNVKKQIEYWIKTAKSDLETVQVLFDAGKNLHHCLFFCHLVLEKGLKALVAKHTKQIPPKIHNLPLLSQMAGLELSAKQKDFFVLMNSFNIEGRYPDEQYEVYGRATTGYTKRLVLKTREEFAWMERLAKQ